MLSQQEIDDYSYYLIYASINDNIKDFLNYSEILCKEKNIYNPFWLNNNLEIIENLIKYNSIKIINYYLENNIDYFFHHTLINKKSRKIINYDIIKKLVTFDKFSLLKKIFNMSSKKFIISENSRNINNILNICCEVNNVKIFKYFYTLENKHNKINEYIGFACQYNSIEIFKYLNKELGENFTIDKFKLGLNYLTFSYNNNKENFLIYLFKDKKFQTYSQDFDFVNYIIKLSIKYNKLDMFKFILKNKLFYNGFNINQNNYEIIDYLKKYKVLEFFKYLFLEYNLEVNDEIKQLLRHKNCSKIRKIYESRNHCERIKNSIKIKTSQMSKI